MKNVNHRQRMTLTDFKIDLVVRRRYFQNPGAEFRIDCFVADNRQFFARKRAPNALADQVAIPRIVGMNGHARVGHDRFRPRRGDLEKAPGLIGELVSAGAVQELEAAGVPAASIRREQFDFQGAASPTEELHDAMETR